MVVFNFQLKVTYFDLDNYSKKIKSGVIKLDFEDLDDLVSYIQNDFLETNNILLLELEVPAINLVIHPKYELNLSYHFELSEIEKFVQSEDVLTNDELIFSELKDNGINNLNKKYKDENNQNEFILNFKSDDEDDPLDYFTDLKLSKKQYDYIRKLINMGCDKDDLFYEIADIVENNESRKTITSKIKDIYNLFLSVQNIN